MPNSLDFYKGIFLHVIPVCKFHANTNLKVSIVFQIEIMFIVMENVKIRFSRKSIFAICMQLHIDFLFHNNVFL